MHFHHAAASAGVATFATRGNVMYKPPPTTPPAHPFGDYCWRATCFVEDTLDAKIAAFMGYDSTITVSDAVLKSCQLHCKIRPGTRCSEPQLVLLPAARVECSGQIFFYMDGKTTRVV